MTSVRALNAYVSNKCYANRRKRNRTKSQIEFERYIALLIALDRFIIGTKKNIKLFSIHKRNLQWHALNGKRSQHNYNYNTQRTANEWWKNDTKQTKFS